MTNSNLPITSREYKLLLNTARFRDRKKGAKAFWTLVKFLTDRHAGTVHQKQDKVHKRRTHYVDTAELALRRRGFVVRVRKERGEDEPYKITLKYRAPDRYISAVQPACGAKADESKFEEDILPPFVSKFARSFVVRKKNLPRLDRMKHLVGLFPDLDFPGISGSTRLETVNAFTAREVALWLGKLNFTGDPEPPDEHLVKTCLTFWYFEGNKRQFPLVAEFSFDYEVLKSEKKEQQKLEQFPQPVVEATNAFFRTLQRQSGWVNLAGTTKTAFAYRAFWDG